MCRLHGMKPSSNTSEGIRCVFQISDRVRGLGSMNADVSDVGFDVIQGF